MKKALDRFTLVDTLGGESSSTYVAEENLPGGLTRRVAVKLLPELPKGDKAALEQLAAHVKLLAALGGHPHLVPVYGIGLSGATPWIAMELQESSVAQNLEKPAEPGDIQRVLEHILDALAYLHAQQPPVIHNDLKPSNILLDRWGQYKLGDLALASLPANERTYGLSTIPYAAPELLSREFGPICPATDLYALGLIAYHMALGARQWRQQFPAVFPEAHSSKDANPRNWMAWHTSLTTRAAPLQEVRKGFPEELGSVIAKLMTKPLNERYTSAAEAIQDLRTPLVAVELEAAAPAGRTPAAPTRPGAAPAPLAPAASAPPAPRAPGIAVPRPPAATPGVPTTAGKPAPGGEQYYVRLRGKLTGPFPLAVLQRQVKQGIVSRLHQVSVDGVTWRSASTVEGLFS